MTKKRFGWIPPKERTKAQKESHVAAMASMPAAFQLRGTYHETTGRVSLWQALQQVLGVNDSKLLPFNWQTSGSCVGAGGGNMAKTVMAVEIMQGEMEEYRELWWPYTYGRSRLRAGMRNPGEGSLGSTYAEAATKDGYLARDEKAGLPEFGVKQNWLQLSSSVEVRWSDGDSSHALECREIALLHLIRTAAPIGSSAEAKAALTNGYPLTLASNFGTRGIRARGNPPINVGEWNDNWPHQMSCEECWDHPTEGLVFLIQNNWGPDAHPAPTQGEPPGSFYITASTMDRICRDEVFAFSYFSGFPTRTLDWLI